MPIIIDISPLLKSVGKILKIDETETVSYPEDGLDVVKPVHFSGELINTGRIIVLKGSVDTALKLECGRCLKEYNYPVRMKIEEEYKHANANEFDDEEDAGDPKTGEVELKDEDLALEVGPDNLLNVSEAIRQNLLTEIPIKPLCKELCPRLEVGVNPRPEVGVNKGENNASTKEATQ